MPARLDPANPTARRLRARRRRARPSPEQNALCFVGPHRRFNPFTKSYYSLEPGQGHFGPGAWRSHPSAADWSHPSRFCLADAIPGDARWRRGESVSLKTARDSMVSLEMAAHAQMVYQKA